MLDFGLARQFTNSNQEVRPVSALCRYYYFFFNLKSLKEIQYLLVRQTLCNKISES